MKAGIPIDTFPPEGEHVVTIVSTSHVVGQYGPQTKITFMLQKDDGTSPNYTRFVSLPPEGQPLMITNPVAQLVAAAIHNKPQLERGEDAKDDDPRLLGKKVVIVIRYFKKGEKSKKAGEDDWGINGFKPYIEMVDDARAQRIRAEFQAVYPNLQGPELALKAQNDIANAIGATKKVNELTAAEAGTLEAYLKAMKAINASKPAVPADTQSIGL